MPTNPSNKTIYDEERKQPDDPVEDEDRTNESAGAKYGGEDEDSTEKGASAPTNPSKKTINDEERNQQDDGAKDGGEDKDSTEKVAGTPTNPSDKTFSEEKRNQQDDLLEREDCTIESAGAKDGLGDDKEGTKEAVATPLNPSKKTINDINDDKRKQQNEQGEEEDCTNEAESQRSDQVMMKMATRRTRLMARL